MIISKRLLLKLIRTILFIALYYSLGCISSSHFGNIDNWINMSFDTIPDQEDYPEAGAVILLDEAQLEVFQRNGKPFSTVDRHTVVKILNERGYSFANVVIPYEAGTKISRIQARTRLPDGRIVSLLTDQVFDTNLYSDYVYYSDTRAKRFAMPAVEVGCVVEYRWRKTVNHFDIWTYWPFQREEPVLLSRYTVTSPRELGIRHKTYGNQIHSELRTTSLGDKIQRVWEANDVPAFIPEISAPPGNEAIGHIKFSPLGVNDWEDIATWFRDLAEDRMKPNEQVKTTTRRLIQGLNSPEEILRRIFEYVRDNVRYVPIEIGIGGYQPHHAATVLRNNFGDCKDMTTLIIAMADAAGIEVHPVLISTWPNGKADSSLVSQAHFNHVIALSMQKDGSEIWMDATEKKCPFGELPWYDQNRFVLVVFKKDGYPGR